VGSGTTAVVAEKLGRRWVACDTSPVAVHATRKRLLRLPQVGPIVVQHAAPIAPGSPVRLARGEVRSQPPSAPRKLGARVAVDGRSATIELASFALPRRAVPTAVRAEVAHWSQWLDGWCIDWDHRGGALVAGSHVWRPRARAALPLSATHSYDGPGRYVALVKAFDVLGGEATKRLEVDVA
jgi:hypothetical protein